LYLDVLVLYAPVPIKKSNNFSKLHMNVYPHGGGGPSHPYRPLSENPRKIALARWTAIVVFGHYRALSSAKLSYGWRTVSLEGWRALVVRVKENLTCE
jgi:hypothetical protein